MAGIFRSGEEKPQARCRHRARISTLPERKRPPSRGHQPIVFTNKLQSLNLVFCVLDSVAAGLEQDAF